MKTEDEKLTLKKIIVWFIIIIMILIVIAAVARGEMVMPGQCFSQTIDVGYNETFNQVFEVCAEDCPFFDLDITLDPGQTESYNHSQYNVTAYCTTEGLNASRCIIDDTIDPGEKFEYESAVCDIEVRSRDCDDCDECDYIDSEYKVDFRVLVYDDETETFEIEFADNSYTGQLGKGLDVQGEMFFTCPLITVNETTDVLVEQCRDIIPTYCGLTADLLIRLNDNLREQELKLNDRIANLEADKSLRKEMYCMPNEDYVDYKVNCITAQNESEDLTKKYIRLESKNNRLTDTIGFWQVLTVFFVCSSAGLFTYIFLKTGKLSSGLGGQ